MKSSLRWLLLAILGLPILPGCMCNSSKPGPTPPPGPGVLETTKDLVLAGVNSLHDLTGWLLNKDDVKVETLETVPSGDRRMAKVRITVSRNEEAFSTVVEQIESDSQGIPTEEGTTQIRNAVEKIKKDVLSKLQK